MIIGTRKKIYSSTFQLSTPRKVLEMETTTNISTLKLQLIQSTTIRDHENMNAEEKKLPYVSSLNSSEGVGNGITVNNSEFIRKVHNCNSSNPQQSEAIRIRTRKKKILLYVPTLNASEVDGNGTTIHNADVHS